MGAAGMTYTPMVKLTATTKQAEAALKNMETGLAKYAAVRRNKDTVHKDVVDGMIYEYLASMAKYEKKIIYPTLTENPGLGRSKYAHLYDGSGYRGITPKTRLYHMWLSTDYGGKGKYSKRGYSDNTVMSLNGVSTLPEPIIGVLGNPDAVYRRPSSSEGVPFRTKVRLEMRGYVRGRANAMPGSSIVYVEDASKIRNKKRIYGEVGPMGDALVRLPRTPLSDEAIQKLENIHSNAFDAFAASYNEYYEDNVLETSNVINAVGEEMERIMNYAINKAKRDYNITSNKGPVMRGLTYAQIERVSGYVQKAKEEAYARYINWWGSNDSNV